MKTPSIVKILSMLREHNGDDLCQYSTIVKHSFDQVRPVFEKPRYADFFWHCATTVPGWIADVVLANAHAESEGSRKLLSFWRSTIIDKKIEDSILFHAKDEARHSHLFVKLVSIAFPGSNSSAELNAISDSLTKVKKTDLIKDSTSVSNDILLDNLIQMNMGEIRTLIHMHFLGPVILAMTPKESKDKTYDILQGLANDEIVHIGYTAKLIEDWCLDDNYDSARQIYRKRLEDFHEITLSQTEDTILRYGQGKYPELLEI